tara:strand:- start:88 stop:639 length:552 start_codon:yes stop_codon:yes gene_type:complete
MYFFLIFFKILVIFFSILLVSSRGVMLSLLNLTGIVTLIVFFCFFFNFDFLAMIYLIVYIGAVTVLFLFVLMMLNFKKGNFDKLLINSYFLSILLVFSISWFFFFYLSFNYNSLIMIYNDYFFNYLNFLNILNLTENIKVLGNILYTYRFFDIIIVTLILLVGMIGSIVLVLDLNTNNLENSI